MIFFGARWNFGFFCGKICQISNWNQCKWKSIEHVKLYSQRPHWTDWISCEIGLPHTEHWFWHHWSTSTTEFMIKTDKIPSLSFICWCFASNVSENTKCVIGEEEQKKISKVRKAITKGNERNVCGKKRRTICGCDKFKVPAKKN